MSALEKAELKLENVARVESLEANERGLAPLDSAMVDAYVDFWGKTIRSDGCRVLLPAHPQDAAARSLVGLRHTMKV
jgi:hypothetical protein